MMPKVFLLETASHMVKLLTGSVLEGIINGNIEKPAVKIIPAMAMMVTHKHLRKKNLHRI